MKRRRLITTFAGALLSGFFQRRVSQAEEKEIGIASFIDVTLGKRFDLSIDSSAIDVTDEWRKEGWDKANPDPTHRERISLIHLNWGVLYVSHAKRMTGHFDADFRFVKNVDYWISIAAFDGERQLLGAAVHHQPLELNGGFIESNREQFKLDFGVSSRFEKTRLIAVSISGRRDLETQ